MKVFYDRKRAFGLIITVSIIAFAFICFSIFLFTVELGLGIFMLGLSLFVLSFIILPLKQTKKGPAFEIGDTGIIINGKFIDKDDLLDIRIIAPLGLKNNKKYKDLDELFEAPPVANITGNIIIVTINKKYNFLAIKDVMEAFQELNKICLRLTAIYLLGNRSVIYRGQK